MLTKITVEAALNDELEDYLGCEKIRKAIQRTTETGIQLKR